VNDGEGNFEHPRQRLREQRFAGTSRADQQDVRFLNFDITAPLHHLDAFVMLVDSDGEFLLGVILADDIFVEEIFDLGGLGQRGTRSLGFLLRIITDDLDADVYTLVAYINGRPSNQLLDFILALATEATA